MISRLTYETLSQSSSTRWGNGALVERIDLPGTVSDVIRPPLAVPPAQGGHSQWVEVPALRRERWWGDGGPAPSGHT